MSIDLSTYKSEKSPKKDSNIPVGRMNFKKKISDKNKEILYRELGMLLRSGVDFKKSLEILGNQSSRKADNKLILQIKERVVEGKSIYESMKETGQFSPYEYYSIQIGEETRKLEEVLVELQKYFNRKIQMRRQVVSVLTYPSIVMAVTILVLYFMLNKVVPMFSSVFKQFGSELPQSTQVIIKLSNHSGIIFTILILSIALMTGIHVALGKRKTYRSFMARLVLKIPHLGTLIKKIYISRFCQAMNLLIKSRTTLINSLRLTSKMIGFYPIESAIEVIQEDIMKGVSLSDSLKKHAVFESKMISMIEVAEQVNQLDTMFERLAEQYNEEINHRTKMIGVVLEPLIIIIIGLIVGIIMVSMYAPMFDLSKIIKQIYLSPIQFVDLPP